VEGFPPKKGTGRENQRGKKRGPSAEKKENYLHRCVQGTKEMRKNVPSFGKKEIVLCGEEKERREGYQLVEKGREKRQPRSVVFSGDEGEMKSGTR